MLTGELPIELGGILNLSTIHAQNNSFVGNVDGICDALRTTDEYEFKVDLGTVQCSCCECC